jgi:uncharacterized protein YjdB
MRKPGLALWVLTFLWSLALTACGGDTFSPDRLQIEPASVDVEFGGETTLRAKAASGADIRDAGVEVTWTSRDPAKVTVTRNADGSATVKGIGAGAVTVEARLDELTATATVTVGAAPLTAIGITPPDPSIAEGTMVALTATGTYADTTTANLTSTATWSSTDTGVATVGADGRVRAVAVGTTTIRAVKDGVTGSTTLTVTAAELTGITVTPINPSVPKGRTVQLTATGTFTDQSTQDLTDMVTWSSANDAIAAVDADGLVTGVAAGSAAVTATLGAVSGSTTVNVSPATLVSLAVTPVNPTVARGRVQQFIATGTYTDSSTQNLTTAVTWTSSNQVIASISNVAGSNGQATALDPGSTVITATMGAFSDSTLLTVTPAVVATIEVTPASPSIADGRTQQFTATGIYTDATTADLTGAVAWSSSNDTLATISNAAGSRGLATAAAPGTVTITAAQGLVSGTATLTITDAELVSIAVTPVNPSLAAGLSRQFTAIGTFSDASTQDLTGTVTWSSTVPAAAQISNAAGSRGLATALAVGSTQIRATSGATSGATTLTVTAAELVSIGVTPAAPSVAKGRSQQFTAIGTFTDASTLDLTGTATWSSTVPAVATVSNAAGSRGLASTLTTGQTGVVATSGAISGSAQLTVTDAVLDSIAIDPAAPSLSAGRDLQLTATGTFSDQTTQDLTETVTWASADVDIATVSNAAGTRGLAHGVAAGTVQLSATSGVVVGTVSLEVTNAVLESIEVTPTDPSVAAGRTAQLTATGLFSDGSNQDLTAQVTWSSSDDTTASVSNDPASIGLASTFVVGQVTITATLAGIDGTTTLTVTDAELDSIEVSPAGQTLAAGYELQLTATGTYSDSSTQDLTTQVTWSSSDDGVATVSNDVETQGLVHGWSPGTVTIGAELGGVTGSVDLEVTPAELLEITIEPLADEPLPAGLTRQYAATGSFSDLSTADITTQVTWATSDDTVLAISNAGGSEGLATALAVGTVTITATQGGISATKTVEVSAAQLVSIEVTPADVTVPLGLGPFYVANGLYTDNNTVDITEQVTWSSSDQTVMTIANAPPHGKSTTVAAGSATISAELDGVTGTTTVTVTGASIVEIEVTPANPSVALGRGVNFTATAIYSDASTDDITEQATWDTGDPGVATVSNAAGNRGRATSVATGAAIISAELGGVTGTTTLTVTPVALESITLAPAAPTMPVGRDVQMVATGLYSDDTTADLTADVTWDTVDAGVALVSNAAGTRGQVHGVAAGSTTLTAVLDTISAQETVTVTPAVLETITLTPDPASLPKGRTLALTATGHYSDGADVDITADVTWTTTTPAILSVSNVAPHGVVTGLDTGNGAVRATDPATDVHADLAVEVTPAVLDSIAVAPSGGAIAVNATRQLTATGTYSDGSQRDVTEDADTLWSSANQGVATVSNAAGQKGLVTGVAIGGPINISAAQLGKSGTAVISVAATPTVSSVTPADGTMGVGTNTNIVMTFSIAMTPGSLTVSSTGGACTGSLQLSSDNFATCVALNPPAMSGGNTIATLTPVGGLSFGLTYKGRVTTSALSSVGVPLAADVTQPNGFTTRTDPCAGGLVISQVYPGGGNSGASTGTAQWRNDFVELRNAGTTDIALGGLAVQYNPETSTAAWGVHNLPVVTLGAGKYFLIQFSSGGANGVVLESPDSTNGAINIAAGGGKIAITNNTTALTGPIDQAAEIAAVVDLVGWGSSANAFEGSRATAPSGTTTNTSTITRANAGCRDGNNNGLDFTVVNAVPRNSMTVAPPCACTANETNAALEMDYCVLQHPPSTTTAINVATEDIYARVFEDTFTQPAGANAAIACQIGYGPTNVNPSTNQAAYTWTNAAFNVQVGNDDEYKATLTSAVAGNFRYTARFSRDNRNWTYCDLDGAGANAGLTFDLPSLGALTVTP